MINTPIPDAVAAGSSRCFTALLPQEPVRQAFLDWQRRWQWPARAALVAPQALHLTVHFIGDVPNWQLPQLTAALELGFNNFTLEFREAMLWPHAVAVLEPLAPPPALASLHAAQAAALQRLGLPVQERAFRPHVTLARRAGDASPPHDGPAIRWDVDSVVLMQSQRGVAGNYQVVRRYPV
jgi:2'-5' RNA ligase